MKETKISEKINSLGEKSVSIIDIDKIGCTFHSTWNFIIGSTVNYWWKSIIHSIHHIYRIYRTIFSRAIGINVTVSQIQQQQQQHPYVYFVRGVFSSIDSPVHPRISSFSPLPIQLFNHIICVCLGFICIHVFVFVCSYNIFGKQAPHTRLSLSLSFPRK